jgi:hypothetical protein
MRSKVLALILVAVTLLATSNATLAQQSASNVMLAEPAVQTADYWSDVQAVSIGEKLALELKTGKKLQGNMAGVSDIKLSITKNGKVTDIERVNIQRIYRVVPKSIAKSVGKSTLIGAAVGFGGGAGAGLALGAYEDISTAEVMGILGLLGAGIGAGIGAMTGLFTGARKEKIQIYGPR